MGITEIKDFVYRLKELNIEIPDNLVFELNEDEFKEIIDMTKTSTIIYGTNPLLGACNTLLYTIDNKISVKLKLK